MHNFSTLSELINPSKDLNQCAIIDRTGPEIVEISYGQLRQRINAATAQLAMQYGVKAGDCVALLGANSVSFISAYFALLSLGAVVAPMNYSLSEAVLEALINDAQASLVIVDEKIAGNLALPVQQLSLQTLDQPSVQNTPTLAMVDAQAQALILYTSGSTGQPKGVMLSHASQVAALRNYGPMLDLMQGLTSIIAAPLFHMNALTNLHLMLAAHGCFVLLEKFDVAVFADALTRHGVALAGGVPPMMAKLSLYSQTHNLDPFDQVLMVALGSAPLTEPVLAACKRLFPAAQITNGYGTTEIGPGVFGQHPNGVPRPERSIGYPNPVNQLRLVDGPDDNQGVLEVKGPVLSSGYKNFKRATDAKFRDGWYRTGDILRRDDNGFYFFVGREDDMFVCNGENIYPAEVETLLERHPDINQAAVIALPDDSRGAIPVAFVVSNTATLNFDQVKHFYLEHGPAYQHPRQVHFVDQLPVNTINKIDKKQLLTQALATQESTL